MCVGVVWLKTCHRLHTRFATSPTQAHMEQLNAELVRVSAERKRLQRQATGKETRVRARRERALRVGTIAFCHDPIAGSSLANAILRK